MEIDYALKKKSLFISSIGTLGKYISLGFFGPTDLYRCELLSPVQGNTGKNVEKSGESTMPKSFDFYSYAL